MAVSAKLGLAGFVRQEWDDRAALRDITVTDSTDGSRDQPDPILFRPSHLGCSQEKTTASRFIQEFYFFKGQRELTATGR
jgi:hypothetical protein